MAHKENEARAEKREVKVKGVVGCWQDVPYSGLIDTTWSSG